MTPRIVAVIPALNEEESIEAVVRGLPDIISRIIVVDNGSTDLTASRARQAGASVVLQPERGYGAACMAGVEADSGADIYLFLDGDGSDPPEKALTVLRALQDETADVALGVRRGEVEPGSMFWHQRLGNLWMSWLIRRLSGKPVHDLPSFKAIRGPILHSLGLRERRHGWTAELITRCACRQLRLTEVATGYRRRSGHSKVSGSVKASALAAYRLNSAILRVWLSEARLARGSTGNESNSGH